MLPGWANRVARTRSVLVVPDAGKSAGMGHVARCLALAEAFDHLGWDAAVCVRDVRSSAFVRRRGIAVRSTLGGRWSVVVIDSYAPHTKLARARQLAPVTVAVDDLGEVSVRDVDIVLRPALGARPSPGVLAGGAFVLLPREYWTRRRGSTHRALRCVVLSLGSRPPARALSRIRALLDRELNGAMIRIAEGAAARRWTELRPLLEEADLAVVSGGQTLHESLALGVPTVVVQTADNQRRQILGAVRARAAIAVGSWSARTFERRCVTALRQAAKIAERRRLARNAARAIDGRGALRAARAIGGIV
jgi:UDP-2,4-diacetamido-2,4,6-trideoxy-beta-L-altropyranose hydrolase